jgi:hypothetical protein
MTADDIILALLELDEAMSTLEESVNVLEKIANGQQRDLFGNWIGGPPPANEPAYDTALLSRKLDAAIGRVQQILSEAA